jgi:pullulanase-type alpha-1,6-glucosidase
MSPALPALTLALLVATTGHAAATPAPTLADCDGPDFARTLRANTTPVAAQAQWMTRDRIRWPAQRDAAAMAGGAASAAAGGSGAAPGAAPAGASGAPSTAGLQHVLLHTPAAGGAVERLVLLPARAPLPPAVEQRFGWAGPGIELQLPRAAAARAATLLQGELVLAELDGQGHERRRTALQHPGVLDELYAAAERIDDLGATVGPRDTRFKLWAPTASAVALCLHPGPEAPAARLVPLARDAKTGAWAARLPGNLSGQYFTYLVDVVVRGTGFVRNRVTDPYALSLNADSRRTWIGSLDDPSTMPPGWKTTPRPGGAVERRAARDGRQGRKAGGDAPKRGLPSTDLVIYELHVRDFSVGDASVPPAQRGKYGAFTVAGSRGMQHLQLLERAGLTDVHLLPVFDLATVPERGCSVVNPARLAALPTDSPEQQAIVMADAAGDCFNWGYDPFHFTAPEGSYATDANDGAVRLREFRAMVQALHRAGLRVGMDVVYNHTTASGQSPRSVLDRIVPGYYQRLNGQGQVETSTCCDNTATEHRMMAKLMIDSAVVWARDHRIDSFRFDLMGHQPRAAMERLQRSVNRATGRHIHLIGEGWNFGEVADGKRFVQASQLSLNGSGIGSFSDRGRDAARGGGCCDNAEQTLQRQGWLNGLHVDPNPHAPPTTAADLQRTADLIRVGLAGTLRDYVLHTHEGVRRPLAQIDYAGGPAGFASQPGEVVNYVENHDNPTLFDVNVLKLPPGTTAEDRARVQVLGLALTAFSQGTAYFHAGVELLRSKSGDRNSFDSGDWFNRLDWTLTDNGFGAGLPPKGDNAAFWPAWQPLLANASAIKPTPEHIAFTRNAFVDLLKIRSSSRLFRLTSADEVQARLHFHDTGPLQSGSLVIGRLDGRGLAGAGYTEVLYAINVDKAERSVALPELQGRAYVLHPVHTAPGAADARVRQSRWDAATGTLVVPPRTAVVHVLR